MLTAGQNKGNCLRKLWKPFLLIGYRFLSIMKHVSIKVLGSDNLRSFKAEKRVEFLPPTKLKKIVRPRVEFFEPVPQLAYLPTCNSRKWHFSHFSLLLRIWVPQLPVYPFLCLFFLILQIYEWYFSLNIFFIFESFF